MGLNTAIIQKIYIAYFSRPADVLGLEYWEKQIDQKMIGIEGLAQSFSQQIEYQTMYGGKSTREVISSMYRNLFGREADKLGLDYWTLQVETGAVNMGTAALAILNGPQAGSSDAQIIENKVKFSLGFTAILQSTPKSNDAYKTSAAFTQIRDALQNVSIDPSTAIVTVPSLSTPLEISVALDGINSFEIKNPIEVKVNLTGLAVLPGYKIEILNGNNSFEHPTIYTISENDIKNKSLMVSIPANSNWGEDGNKTIGGIFSDLNGKKGIVGGQVTISIDTTPPLIPLKVTVSTAVHYDEIKSIDFYINELKFDIEPGWNSGSYALLKIGDKIVAKDESILITDKQFSFTLDSPEGKQIHSYFFTTPSLPVSMIIFDAAGNQLITTPRLNLPAQTVYTFKSGDVPKNISIIPVGGVIQDNSVNPSNTNLKVSATIDGYLYFGSEATLMLNGVAIAKDSFIQSTDKSIDFDLGTNTNTALLEKVKNGGELSISIVDMNKDIIKSVQNVNLKVNNITPSQPDIPTLKAPTNIQFFAMGGVVVKDHLNSSNLQLAVFADILPGVAVGGYATLQVGGVTVATSSVIYPNDSSVQFRVGDRSPTTLQQIIKKSGAISVTLYDKNGLSATSTVNPDLWVNFDTAQLTTAKFDTLKFDAINTTENAASNYDKLFNALHVTVDGLSANVARAELNLGSTKISTDNLIKAGDTQLDFTFKPTYDYFFGSTSFNISLFDSNGNQLPSDSDLRTVWALNNYSRNHLGPSPATEVLISATGGNVVTGKFNSTNTGLYAQAKIQVKDLIGGKVELHTWHSSKVLASVSIDQNSSDIVRFDLSAMGSKDLQSLLSSSPRFTFWVYDNNGLITQTESMQFQAIAAGISHADVSANANVENPILEKLNPVTAAYTVGGTENVNEIGNSGFTVNSPVVTVIGISGLSVDIT